MHARSLARSAIATLILLAIAPLLAAQAVYTTGFESFTPGDVSGQEGWGRSDNSPTGGSIVAVPAGTPGSLGSQTLAVRSVKIENAGVANNLYSPTISPAAGETGSTAGGVVVASPQTRFEASLWYRTPDAPPISVYGDGRFAELDPSSKGSAPGDLANRYAVVRLLNSTNTAAGVPRVYMRWINSGGYTGALTATLEWGTWYRFDYLIDVVDGLDGAEPNDRFLLTIRDVDGIVIGSGCGSTWEIGWKNAAYGFGGGTTPRAINGFDFWSFATPNGTVAGYVDELTMTASSPAPLQATIAGATMACAGGTTTLTASSSGGSGSIGSYTWRDASNTVVGNASTFDAAPGTYTLTINDTACATATSAGFTVGAYAALNASITGTTDVCYGATTTLTANASGGSGTVSGYTWRDASNAIVGTGSTLVAGVGTYTVTVTDAQCGSHTSAPVTVQKTCNATPVVSWSNPADIVYGTPLSGTQLNATANVPGTFTYTPPAGTVLDAGANQVLSVDFAPDDSANYDPVNDTTVQINVLQATPVVTVSGGPFVYDGTPHAATAVARDAHGNEVSGTFTFTYDGSPTAPTNAGTYAVVATFTSSDSNFTNASGNGTLTISKATPVVSWSDPANIVYGTPLTGAQLNATANVSGTFTYTPPAGTVLNAGANQVLSVDFVPNDTANYEAVNDTTVTIDVEPATPTVTVTGGTFGYDGTPHAATAVARDANGNEVSGSFVITYDGSTTAPTNAGTYAVVATFTSSDPNFANASGNGSLTIAKATPVVSWSDPADIVYGTPLSATQLDATANVSGTFTYTPPAGTVLNAGANQTLSVDFAPTDATNYDPVNDTAVQIDVLQATPVVTVSGGPFVYDGTPHAATAVARDANGNEVSGTFTFTYDGSPTAPTNAGTYAVVASFTSSDSNFTSATGNGTLTISKATPAVSWSDPASIVYGTPLTATQLNATANVSGTFTYTPPAGTVLNAGANQVLSVDFVPNDTANYEVVNDTTVTIDVEPATPTVTVTGGTFGYDGTPHAATAVARDSSNNVVSGSFAITYDGSTTAPTNAGTYAVVASFTSSDPNFANASGNGSLTIAKATPVVNWSDPADIVYGTPLSATQLDATANISGTFTYTPPAGTVLNAGANQSLSVDFTPDDATNYDPVNGTTVQIDVLQATPVVTVSGGPFVYDGTPHAATAVARDANGNEVSGTFTFTYDGSPAAPTNAGTYAVVATFTSSDSNFTGATGNGSLTISKATPVVSWSDPASIVYGTPLGATQLNATANVSGTFTYTPPAGTVLNAGANQVLSVDFVPNDTANYEAVNDTTVTINIEQATPTVTVTAGTFGYDGAPHAATAVARDANGNDVSGSFVITYDGSTTAPTNAGTYAVVATFTSSDPNFTNASGTGTLTITKAPTAISIAGFVPDPPRAGESTAVSFTLTGTFGSPAGQVTIASGDRSCNAAPSGPGCSLVFPSPGSVKVTVTYSGDANHEASTAFEMVNVVASNAAVTATLEGSAAICAGTSTPLRVTLQGAAPWRIAWSDGVTETTSDPVHLRSVQPSQTTTYTLQSVSDRDDAGSVSGSATVTVTDIPRPLIVTSSPFVLGQPVTLIASATDGTSFQWFHDGAEVAGATSAEFTIDALSREDFGTWTVRVSRDGCTSALSAPFTVELTSNPIDEHAVLPVVGNTPGANGSFFRTTIHLANATDEEAEGEITFLDPSLPKYTFRLAPREMRFAEDLVPASWRGLTSADIRRLRGPMPLVIAHVFNDAGARGTSGLIERAVPVDSLLHAGHRVVLVTPENPEQTRMTIGLRSLSEGLQVRVTRRAANGEVIDVLERRLAPSTLVHESSAQFLGEPAGAGESLTFEIVEGSGVVYGSATDNETNDPNMQLAANLRRRQAGRFVLPVAGASAGLFGSFFRTALQLHNPHGDDPLTATLTFHPMGVSGSPADPSRPFEIGAGDTLSMSDVAAAISPSISGLGSLDVATSGPAVFLARVYNDAEEGETSLTTDLIDEERFLRAGEEGVLVAPHAPESLRFNVSLRTLAGRACFTADVRDRRGVKVHSASRCYDSNVVVHASAQTLLGYEFTGDESVTFTMNEGRAIFLGSWTDNVTQDPAVQFSVRPVGEP